MSCRAYRTRNSRDIHDGCSQGNAGCAVQRGVVSPTFAAANVVGIIARKATKQAQVKAVNMMVDKALTDPDFAAQLLKENNPANKAALARSDRKSVV